jgi:hypothetical protein
MEILDIPLTIGNYMLFTIYANVGVLILGALSYAGWHLIKKWRTK